MYDFIPHIWIFLVVSLFIEGLAVYAWRFRSIPGATPYAIHKAAISLLLLSLILASTSTGFKEKIFWIRLCQIGMFIATLAWVAVTLQMTGHNKWLNNCTITMMLAIFTFAVMALYSNLRYGLYWSHITLIGNNVRATDGFLNKVIIWSGYLILSACNIFFIYRFINIKGILRTQAGIVVFSTCVTMAGYFCWRLIKITELRQDLFALAFTISGFLDAYAFFRLRMFDIMSLAEAMVTKTMGDCLVVLDNQGLVIGLNPAAERMLAKSSAEVSGTFAEKVFAPWPEVIHQIENTNTPTGEIFINHQYYNVLITPLSRWDRRELGKALVFQDVTAEKKAQALLIEQQQAVAVLKERDRLSRELHDGNGQLLSYFNMQLEAARSFIAQGNSAQAEPLLKRMAQLTQGLHADIRESIAGLKTTAEDGFLDTLDQYLHWFSQNYGIKTDLEVKGKFTDEMLPLAAAVQLQRIIQEALTNVRKHAGAEQVRVIIQTNANKVEIVVQDNGAGFYVAEALAKGGSYGLHIMRERAVEIGADLSFDSKPKAGTRIKIGVPIN